MEGKEIDFIINGELYLKRGPEIFDPSSSKLNELSNKISDIELDISKENPDFSKLPMLEKYKDIKNKLESVRGQQDYTGTRSFWQFIYYGWQ